MFPRILAWILVLGTVFVAAVLLWPQGFGLQNQWVAAHVVALRGAAAVLGAVAAVALAVMAIPRPTRTVGLALAVVMALFAAGNVAVIAARGTGGSDVAGDASSVTVLSWNTLGEVPDAATIADLALGEGADVVVLPETTGPLGEEVAIAMRDGGSPMWVHTVAFDEVAKARCLPPDCAADLDRQGLGQTALNVVDRLREPCPLDVNLLAPALRARIAVDQR